MLAIFKRDFKSYFHSPMGYIFIAIFLLILNLYFYLGNVMSLTSNIANIFNTMLFVLMFTIPILTMKQFSEEYKLKTDQLLLTSPVGLWSIVLGKFFAVFGVFVTALLFTLAWPVIIAMFGKPEIASLVGNYTAVLLAAAAFISIGLFISSLTESQIIAAVISFALFLGLYILSYASSMFNSETFVLLINWISPYARFDIFARGLFPLDAAVYYLSVTATFLFLTTRVLEKKRWA